MFVHKHFQYSSCKRRGAVTSLQAAAILLAACASPGALSGKTEDRPSQPVRTIGVNGYLWRASLETIAFMPLTAADPFGGVILSDWYGSPPDSGERKKVTVYITDSALRADALKVVVFRQISRGSEWKEPELLPEVARQLENTILARARELRLASLQVD